MSRSVVTASSILRAALLATTALAFVGSGTALARVGVTSATDGDPLGKPPQDAERVLRIGVDVQANEIITTNANDRAHLLFLDGTSLTVGATSAAAAAAAAAAAPPIRAKRTRRFRTPVGQLPSMMVPSTRR